MFQSSSLKYSLSGFNENSTFKDDVYAKEDNTVYCGRAPGGGGGLPYERLMGMCRWMGSHFHDWIDYNGVTFLVELLEWGRTFLGFLGENSGKQGFKNRKIRG